MKYIFTAALALFLNHASFAQDMNAIPRPTGGFKLEDGELSRYINPASFFDIRRGMFSTTQTIGTEIQDTIECKTKETMTTVVLKVEGAYEYSVTHTISDKGASGTSCSPEHSDSYSVSKSKIETMDKILSELKAQFVNYDMYIVNGDLKIFAEVINQVSTQNGFTISSNGQLLFTLKTPLAHSYFLESGELRSHGIYRILKADPNFPIQVPSDYESSSVQTQIDSGLNFPLETLREALKKVPYGEGDGPDSYKGELDMTWLLN